VIELLPPFTSCDGRLYLWDGEYESECVFPEDHRGHHFDGTYWFNEGREVIYGSTTP